MKLLVFTATYNEVDNIRALLEAIFVTVPEAQVLVVDDNSPDGTGHLLDRISSENSRLSVIHRPGKMGVGSAHKLAFAYARDHGFDGLITMDADFSHDPQVLPQLAQSLGKYDFAIGSRFARGGRLDYRGFRLVISHGANFLSKFVLGVIPRETTTSFRAFDRFLLENLPMDEVQADGYSFFLECTYMISRITPRILEIPIHFQDRRFGQSKISQKEIFVGMLTVLRLAWDRFQRSVGLKRPFQLKNGRKVPVNPLV